MRIDRIGIVPGICLMTDRPQHPAVERVEFIERARRQGVALFIKGLFADGHWGPVDGEIRFRRCRAHDFDRLRHDLQPDIVAFQNAYSQFPGPPRLKEGRILARCCTAAT